MEDDRIVISSGATVSPESVASRTFTTGFRGYDQDEVRTFLKRVADELAMVAAREGELREAMQEALYRAAHPQLDEDSLTAALGEHAARLLTNARDAAVNIVSEAETRAERIIGEAESKIARVRAEADGLVARRSEEAERLTAGLRAAVEADVRTQRERARAEAESEVESARAQGREMVAEARALRERMLTDLARRRRAAEVQIEHLRLARQRLLEAYSVVRRTVDEATTELAAAEAEAQPALAAAATGRLPAPVEVETEDAPSQSSATGAPESPPPPGSPPPAGAPAPPELRLPPDAGGSRGTNGGSTRSDDRPETARSGTDPAPAGPSAGRHSRAGAAGSASGSGSGSASDLTFGKDLSPAAAAAPPVRPLVPVPSPAEKAGPSTGELVRSAAGGGLSGPASEGPLEAVPSPAPDHTGPSDDEVAEVPVAEVPAAEGSTDAAVSSASSAVAGEASSVGQVEELFARMRAAQSGATAGPTRETATGPAVTSSPAGAATPEGPPAAGSEPHNGAADPADPAVPSVAVSDESTLSRRDELLEPLGADLARQLKRVLQDEHNEVLDRLRQQRRAVPEAVLPDAAAQKERFSAAARPLLAEAARLGASSAAEGDDAGVSAREVEEWAAELATDLVGPLRDRLERALGDTSSPEDDDEDPGPVKPGGPGSPAADRLTASYRQWKSEMIEPVARHHGVRAYSRAAFVATAEGTHLRWLLDDDGPCPDCDDNVLAGAQVKGQPFPTGQLHPPAHVGCRCLLAVSAP